jgi:L-ascorbate metabolism protein UlaG (beta-lactamase superfamily)
MVYIFFMLMMLVLSTACAPQENASGTEADGDGTAVIVTELVQPTASGKAELTFLGRASVKIVTAKGIVIYVDPFATAPGGYSQPADYILVTHGHSDHNVVSKVTQKDDTVIIKCPKDIKVGDVKTYEGLTIKAVAAYNSNHPKGTGCGYVLIFEDQVIYHSGDTSNIPEMEALSSEAITYALLCADGVYNMDAAEAMEVGKIIKAKYYIPIHTDGEGYYNAENDAAFQLENTVHMKPTETIILTN